MNIHPIPANDKINIQLKKLNEFHVIEQIELYDLDGRIVKQYGLCPTRFYIDVSDVTPGTYMLKVKSNLKTETRRVLISR
jgi:hypothetical protein